MNSFILVFIFLVEIWLLIIEESSITLRKFDTQRKVSDLLLLLFLKELDDFSITIGQNESNLIG